MPTAGEEQVADQAGNPAQHVPDRLHQLEASGPLGILETRPNHRAEHTPWREPAQRVAARWLLWPEPGIFTRIHTIRPNRPALLSFRSLRALYDDPASSPRHGLGSGAEPPQNARKLRLGTDGANPHEYSGLSEATRTLTGGTIDPRNMPCFPGRGNRPRIRFKGALFRGPRSHLSRAFHESAHPASRPATSFATDPARLARHRWGGLGPTRCELDRTASCPVQARPAHRNRCHHGAPRGLHRVAHSSPRCRVATHLCAA